MASAVDGWSPVYVDSPVKTVGATKPGVSTGAPEATRSAPVGATKPGIAIVRPPARAPPPPPQTLPPQHEGRSTVAPGDSTSSCAGARAPRGPHPDRSRAPS